MRRALPTLVVTALAVTTFTACREEPAVQSVGSDKPTKVSVETKEYAFNNFPTEITANVIDLEVKNVGKEAHMAAITELADGKTMADVEKGDASALSFVAGVPTMDAETNGNATFEIQPGDYVMVCFLPAPDGQPHLAKGMLQPFTVKASTDDADLPMADVRIDAKDFSYSPSTPRVKAGETTVRLTNAGPQEHEITVVELDAGKTPADIGAFFANPTPTGPPPFRFLGGVAVRIGASATARVDFDKGGNYAFVCLIPDVADGQPHLAKGMATTVRVTE